MARTYPSRAVTVPGSAGYYESLLDNPNVQRGLAVIRATEGTSRRANPYAVGYGFNHINDLSWHPGVSRGFTTKSGKSQKTTAAGAYQFLSKTWNGVASRLGLKNFGPRSQDIAAVALIDARGGLNSLVKGDLRGFINAVGPEWASLPTAPKAYDQPTKSWGDVQRAWDRAGGLPSDAPLPPMRFQTVASRPVVPDAQAMKTGVLLGALPVGGGTKLAQNFAAPVGKVERSPLAAVAAAFNPISSAQAAPRPNNPTLTPGAMGQGTMSMPSFASARMMAPPNVPTQRLGAPTPSSLSPKQVAAYQDYANTRGYAPIDPVPARMPSPPTDGFLTSALPMGPAQTLQQQPAQPTFVPTPVQNPVQTPPVPQPPVQMLAKPTQQRIDEAFAQAAPPPTPRFTAADVYAGRAQSGQATGGNTVSRDPFGNISVTNKYGATTTTGPDGRQMAGGSPFGGGGIGGPLGPTPPSSPTAAPDVPRTPSQFGNTVRGGVGTVLGGGLGGLLAGPIGAALGAVVARDLAVGKNPIDRLGIGTFSVPVTDRFGFTQPMTFANAKSGGPFPDRPTGQAGALGGKDSNRSERSMRDISPRAADAISKGKGGLY